MKKTIYFLLVILTAVLAGCGGGSSGSSAQLDSIAITQTPNKLTYNTGENLDISGLEVTGYYDDDTSKVEDITMSNISGFDSNTAGEQTIIISLGNESTPFTIQVNEIISSLTLSGVVKGVNDQALEGVLLTVGEESTITNSQGLYRLENLDPDSDKIVVKFTKDNYFDVVRSEEVFGEQSKYEIDIQMISKTDTNATEAVITSTDGGNIELENGSKVELSSNSFVDSSGDDYTGNVNVSLAYLDPTSDNFSLLIPGGSMEATREDDSESILISYGIIKVELEDEAGNLLQLKDDSSSNATITVAVPESQKESAPDSIPLWYFDEEQGIWIEDGEAFLNDDKTLYIGTVSHFTDWNCDVPVAEQSIIEGYVKDEFGNPINRVWVKLGQVSAITDINGYYRRRVPSNIEIEVSIPDFFGISIEGETVVVAPGETERVDFVVPNLQLIEGYLLYSDGTNASGFVTIEWGDNKVHVYAENGVFQLSLPEDITNINYDAMSSDGYTKEGGADLSSGTLTITLGDEQLEFGDNELIIDGTVIPNMGAYAYGIIYDDEESGVSTNIYVSDNADYNQNQNFVGMSFAIQFSGNTPGTYTINTLTEEGVFMIYDHESATNIKTYAGENVVVNVATINNNIIEGTFQGTAILFDSTSGSSGETTVSISGSFSVPVYDSEVFQQ